VRYGCAVNRDFSFTDGFSFSPAFALV
jgi:hypothetical protein